MLTASPNKKAEHLAPPPPSPRIYPTNKDSLSFTIVHDLQFSLVALINLYPEQLSLLLSLSKFITAGCSQNAAAFNSYV